MTLRNRRRRHRPFIGWSPAGPSGGANQGNTSPHAAPQPCPAPSRLRRRRGGRGTVAIYRAGSLRLVNRVRVGVLPDMVTFVPNGRTLVVANEGEPEGYCDGQVDPRGSISIIGVRAGGTRARVRTAGFERWDDREDELRSDGVRVFGPGANASQNLEPEYVAVARNERHAWVSLQENNALAIVGLRRGQVDDIAALGTKGHAAAGSGMDASDEDDRIRIRRWPVRGVPMPDAVAAFTGRGQDYLATANEGDAREYACFEEEARVADLTLDPAAFPDAAELQQDENLGRLQVSATTSPQGPDGYTELHSFGTRSVQVRDAAGGLVWDSGDLIEQVTARQAPEIFKRRQRRVRL